MLADFDWTKPTVGGSSGTWGTELNTILDVIQAHPGIKVVSDATAKAAYVPLLGQVILQADTGTLYKCTNATGPVWAEVSPAATADGTLTTKGDLLVYGSALARLGVGTDGQVLTADAAQALGVKWATPTGGSGNGVPERWYVPAGADEGYDDEFDDGSINDAWIAVDVAGKANSYYEPTGIKGLSCVAPASKGAMAVSGQLKSLGAMTAPCYIETAIMQSAQDAKFHGCGLIFADGVTVGAGTQVVFLPLMQYYMTIALMTNYNSRSDFNDWSYRDSAEIMGRIYLRLAWVSANSFSTYYSIDGVTWIPVHTNYSATLTPTHFGLCDVQFENYAIPRHANFAYFRARSGMPADG